LCSLRSTFFPVARSVPGHALFVIIYFEILLRDLRFRYTTINPTPKVWASLLGRYWRLGGLGRKHRAIYRGIDVLEGRCGLLDHVLVLKMKVVSSDDRIGVVDSYRPDVSQSLDLVGSNPKKSIISINGAVTEVLIHGCGGCGGYIHFLALLVVHDETELRYSGLDGVPAGEPGSEVDVAGQAEVRRVENLVRAGVVKDGLGVDTGLVGEGAETGDGVVEGSVDSNGLGDHVLNLFHTLLETELGFAKMLLGGFRPAYLLDHVKLVLALGVLRGADRHAGKETTEGLR